MDEPKENDVKDAAASVSCRVYMAADNVNFSIGIALLHISRHGLYAKGYSTRQKGKLQSELTKIGPSGQRNAAQKSGTITNQKSGMAISPLAGSIPKTISFCSSNICCLATDSIHTGSKGRKRIGRVCRTGHSKVYKIYGSTIAAKAFLICLLTSSKGITCLETTSFALAATGISRH